MKSKSTQAKTIESDILSDDMLEHISAGLGNATYKLMKKDYKYYGTVDNQPTTVA